MERSEMNEALIKKIKALLSNIVNQAKDDPEEYIKKVDTVENEVKSMLAEGSEGSIFMESAIHEAKGDIYLLCKRPSDAESEYIAMMVNIRQLYTNDEEKYGYTFAKAARKIASFYELPFDIKRTVPMPRKLSRNEEVILESARMLHKEAIEAIDKNGMTVDAGAVRMKADSYYKMGCIRLLRSNIERAEECFKNSADLARAMFNTLRTMEQSYLASRSESALNMIYMIQNKHKEAIEHNRETIARLKEIEPTDPALYGRHIAVAHLYIGKSYSAMEGERLKAIEEYLTAIEKITKVNEIAKKKMTEDVIMFSIAVGDFYKRNGMTANAALYYNNAAANIKNLPEGKCSVACKNALDRITGKTKKDGNG